jgi:hypothetical protein
MNREPINPDDPQMSAYALGELSVAEAAEFETRLQESPLARAELASMREIMSLLHTGLREEWKEGASHPALALLEPFEAGVKSTVVVGDFRPMKRGFASAAAVAAVLAIGAVSFFNRSELSDQAPETIVSVSEVESVIDPVLIATGPVTASHVPRLFLAEEVDDVAALDLAVDSDDLGTRVDPSYLDSNHVIPAGFVPGASQGRVFSPDRSQMYDRVDSYLPPLSGLASGRGVTTGMIETRLGRDKARSSGADSVLVSGYVTMGGGNFAPERIDSGIQGFRPVSISENPVTDNEANLQILADLNGLEKELSELFEEFPDESAEKADLERILERSRKVLSQLQTEFSR